VAQATVTVDAEGLSSWMMTSAKRSASLTVTSLTNKVAMSSLGLVDVRVFGGIDCPGVHFPAALQFWMELPATLTREPACQRGGGAVANAANSATVHLHRGFP
jgi:hypothetical protein